MSYDTNLQNEGDCPDCRNFEKRIDKLNATISQMDSDLYHAQSNLQAVTETNEMLTAEKSELVLNLEACEKERLEAVRKVVERDGRIMELTNALEFTRKHIVQLITNKTSL